MVALKKMPSDPLLPNLPPLPPTARIAAGIVVLGTGVALAVTGVYETNSDPRAVIAVPAGLIFVFGGALFLLPPSLARLQLPLATLAVTSLAVVFNYVAFGPDFAGYLGVGSGATRSGEMEGHLVFSFFAVLMNAAALGLWFKVFARRRASQNRF
jgi:hypothetical protein